MAIKISGSTIIDDSRNVVSAGIVTATSFSGSGADLTALNASNLGSGTVPDARFPATLPAASGVNLTALNGSNISSGTVAAARVATLNQNTTGTADNFTVTANNSTNETVYPVFVDGATGSQGGETDTGLNYNPSTGAFTAVSFAGDGSALTGISAGFSADADLNLFANNTCSGCNLDGTSGCFNVFLGSCAGKAVTTGNDNIINFMLY